MMLRRTSELHLYNYEQFSLYIDPRISNLTQIMTYNITRTIRL